MPANGQYDISQLEHIEGDHYLAWGTAVDWVNMVAACKAATGATIYINPETPPNSAYRSLGDQNIAWDNYNHGGPSAAPPGTSPHGDGKAVDMVTPTAARAWRDAHAAEFGFYFDVSNEDWHGHHPSDTPFTTFAKPKKETTMLALDPTRKKPDGSNQYVVVGNGAPKDYTGTQAQAGAFVKSIGFDSAYVVTKGDWASFIDAWTPAAGSSAPGSGATKAEVQAISDESDKRVIAKIPTKLVP